MQEEIPSSDNFRVLKQQKHCFSRMLKFLHLHEPTGYERDEEHKRTAVRYLALRTMLQQCSDIKISTIQQVCIDKVLRWFEETETNAFSLPVEEDNNGLEHKRQGSGDLQKKAEEKRMVEATFKMYHPETDAEREMNLLWIRRRQEDETKRKKDEEVQQQVHKWAMDRSRDESENLRKRESTKLVAGLGLLLQEGVDQEKPFALRSSKALHPSLAGMAAQLNQSAAVASTKSSKEGKQVIEVLQHGDVASRKQPSQSSRSKQAVQIIIKTRKPSVSTAGGMHFRNHLPPNYVPAGQLAASSVPKTKREISSATLNRTSSNSKDASGILERRASGVSDDPSSASDEEEEEEEEPATGDSVTRTRRSVSRDACHRMKLQSYHVPYYYTDSEATKAPASRKPHPRGTIPVQPLPADPELRCLQEASAVRRVFAIPSEKKANTAPVPTRDEVSSSRKSARLDASKPQRGSKSSKDKRGPSSSRSGVVLPRTAPSYTPSDPLFAASTSDLRQSQMEELEKIRRLFEENHLSFSSDVLERGLLVPEDRPLLESISNLPFPGSRLLSNPLTRRPKATNAKKKPGSSKKKKTKKGKKGKKDPKAPQSSRKALKN
ncbi:hypothetical protein PHYPSEUDO_008099 [Phytophthora pseudosyringae]|uniref:Uncharacterized protein n=1 Tax=Phytophthora pseudosyringae TaxID=221518 RepID=A0A8T1VI26_9STRA|nr:hypothetical protein PHYPSEUDO_008099 [Phytophthora pseudosyringae]